MKARRVPLAGVLVAFAVLTALVAAGANEARRDHTPSMIGAAAPGAASTRAGSAGSPDVLPVTAQGAERRATPARPAAPARPATPGGPESPATPAAPATPAVPADPGGDPSDPPDDPDDPPVDPVAPAAVRTVRCVSADMADVVTFEPGDSGGETSGYALLAAASAEGPFERIAEVASAARTFTVPVAAVRAAYYQVVPFGPGGEGPASAVVSNAEVLMTASVPPSGHTLRSSNGEVVLALAAGSFAETTTVSVAEVAGTPSGKIFCLAGVYEITPSGTLGAPARLSVAYTLGVTHFQVSETLLEAAGLMTYDEGTAGWVSGATNLTLEGGYLSGDLDHFSYWTGATIQPHGTSSTAYCSSGSICHDLTAYPGSSVRYATRDSQVCYNCHGRDGSTASPPAGAAGPNIQAEFYQVSGQVRPPSASTHPVATGDLYCTVCHDPHADPEASPGLLKAWNPLTGGYIQGGGGLAPGAEYCWTCHGTAANKRVSYLVPGYWTGAGGDKKTGWNLGRHSSQITVSGGPKCVACHTGHGASENGLVASTVAGQAVSGNNNTLCLACHTAAVRTYAGAAAYELSAHGRHTQPAQEKCTSCHDPHGLPGVPSLLRASEETACNACHNGVEGAGCNACHTVANGRATPNIQAEIAKTLPNPLAWQRNDVWGDTGTSAVARVRTGDLEGDGDRDIVTAWMDRSLRLHRNSAGNGSAWTNSLIATMPINNEIQSLDFGDLEGDGDRDVLVSYMGTSGTPRTGYVVVYVNTAGDGSAWTARTVRTFSAAFSSYGQTTAAFADLDRDGDLDVASGWWTTDTRWHQNTAGDGSAWGDVQIGTATYQSYRVVTGDLTGDGLADVINGTRNGGVQVWRNDANGTSWSAMTGANTANDVADIALGDVDGDSDNDLVVTSWGQPVRVKFNNGTATAWTDSLLTFYGAASSPAVEVADLDGDGDRDVLVSADSAIYQYMNLNGAGTSWDISYALLSRTGEYGSHADIACADLDGDADVDMATGGTLTSVGRKALWVKNLGFLAPTMGSHPVGTYAGRHSADEATADVGAANRHAECVDCHAPHLTKTSTHTMGSATLAGVLEGVRGVSPTYGAAWTTPTYAEVSAITAEYQLCLRCHSSYTTGYTGSDKGRDFNPANAGTHPIAGAGANLGIRDGAFTLGTPWNPTAGDDADYSAGSPKMTCTDCHGNENASGPKGPHGSTLPAILKARASDDLLLLGGNQNALCLVCHDPATYNTADGSFPTFAKPAGYGSRIYHRHFIAWGAYCVECHDEHGSNAPHMVTAAAYVNTPTGGTWDDFTMCTMQCHSMNSPPYYVRPVAYTNDY